MFAEFLHFYNYTADTTLNEFAKRFFGLVNQMYRLQGKYSLNSLVIANNAANGGSEAEQLADDLVQQSRGNHGILEEVRIVKGL